MTADLNATIDAMAADFTAISDAIWGFAELRFEEFRSSETQARHLEQLGFRVTRDVAGMATAFIAEKGDAGPVIAFLGEFDALAGMSQTADVAVQESQTPGATGHGCGHNLLGTGSMLAAAALAEVLAARGIAGRVRYFGCPAEEGGSGKSFMVRAGCFDDVDMVLTWHPAPFNGVRSTENLAVIGVDYRFSGIASHASNGPHLGRSALDGLELMNIGVNFLREHMPTDARVHYAITDTGGVSPNVVQASAAAAYYVRSPQLPDALELLERVNRIARGAAMMTDTEVEIGVGRSTSNLLPNHALENELHQTMLELGPVPFDAADEEFAAQIHATFNDDMTRSSFKLYNVKGDAVLNQIDRSAPLHRGVLAFDGTSHFRAGSTDVGDVSQVVPTAQIWTPTWAIGTPVHSWQVVAQGRSPGAHKAMIHAARALSATALRAIESPEIIARARAELNERSGGRPYSSPLPADLLPPRPARPAA